jgi:hypothetical protein
MPKCPGYSHSLHTCLNEDGYNCKIADFFKSNNGQVAWVNIRPIDRDTQQALEDIDLGDQGLLRGLPPPQAFDRFFDETQPKLDGVNH